MATSQWVVVGGGWSGGIDAEGCGMGRTTVCSCEHPARAAAAPPPFMLAPSFTAFRNPHRQPDIVLIGLQLGDQSWHIQRSLLVADGVDQAVQQCLHDLFILGCLRHLVLVWDEMSQASIHAIIQLLKYITGEGEQTGAASGRGLTHHASDHRRGTHSLITLSQPVPGGGLGPPQNTSQQWTRRGQA